MEPDPVDPGEGSAAEIIDASDLIVVPGLIDLHVHVFWGVSHFGIDPDISSLGKGVTTVVDAGSAGANTFPAFRKYVVNSSETRIYSLLNISAMGMIEKEIGELEDIRWAMVDRAITMGLQHPDHIVGIKARLSRTIAGDHDVEVLKRTVEAAKAIMTTAIFGHPSDMDEILSILEDPENYVFYNEIIDLVDISNKKNKLRYEIKLRKVAYKAYINYTFGGASNE